MKKLIINGYKFQIGVDNGNAMIDKGSGGLFELTVEDWADYYFEITDAVGRRGAGLFTASLHQISLGLVISYTCIFDVDQFNSVCEGENLHVKILDYKPFDVQEPNKEGPNECTCTHSFLHTTEGCTCGAFKRDMEVKEQKVQDIETNNDEVKIEIPKTTRSYPYNEMVEDWSDTIRKEIKDGVVGAGIHRTPIIREIEDVMVQTISDNVDATNYMIREIIINGE